MLIDGSLIPVTLAVCFHSMAVYFLSMAVYYRVRRIEEGSEKVIVRSVQNSKASFARV
jgi:hypothetical protein